MLAVTVSNNKDADLDGPMAKLKASYERLALAAEAAHADYIQLNGGRQVRCDRSDPGTPLTRQGQL